MTERTKSIQNGLFKPHVEDRRDRKGEEEVTFRNTADLRYIIIGKRVTRLKN